MSKRLCVSPHLSIDELEKRYRQAKTVTERSHYQILWLLGQGRPSIARNSKPKYHNIVRSNALWGDENTKN